MTIPKPEYPQTPGNPHPKTQYIAIEGELEELEIINENLPTDEIEMKARRIIFDIRSRPYIPSHPNHPPAHKIRRQP